MISPLGPTWETASVNPRTNSVMATFAEYPSYGLMIHNAELLLLAEAYAKSRGIRVLRKDFLGHGSDGAV